MNNRIRVPQVRCISDTGEQIGIIATGEALKLALSKDLDLVEISPNANPPVCRIMDFGKFQYQECKRQREAKRKQIQQKVKEVKMHPNIDDNDFQTKARHTIAFLEKGDKVKVLLAFRGREMAHVDLGMQVLARLVTTVGEVAVVDSPAKQFGRNVIMVLAPKPQK